SIEENVSLLCIYCILIGRIFFYKQAGPVFLLTTGCYFFRSGRNTFSCSPSSFFLSSAPTFK
ncbi:hypothetical protein RhiirC2_862820, partial [Rhizophagus irregularis]